MSPTPKPPSFLEVERTMRIYDMLREELEKRTRDIGSRARVGDPGLVFHAEATVLTVAERIAARTED